MRRLAAAALLLLATAHRPRQPASSRSRPRSATSTWPPKSSAKARLRLVGRRDLRRRAALHRVARGLRLGRPADLLEGRRASLPALAGRPVQKLGFPVSRSSSTPVLLMAGYRFRDGQLIVPYAGDRRRDHVLHRDEQRRRRELRHATAPRRASSARPASSTAAACSASVSRSATRPSPASSAWAASRRSTARTTSAASTSSARSRWRSSLGGKPKAAKPQPKPPPKPATPTP